MSDDWVKRALRATAARGPEAKPLTTSTLRTARRRFVRSAVVATLGTITTIAGVAFAIVTVAGHGSDARVHVASSPSDERVPPPSGRIAAAMSAGVGQDLVVIDVGSRRISPIARTPALEDGPSWDPSGNSVAYEGYLGESSTSGDAIFTIDVDGGSPKQVADVAEADAHPAWSPSGDWIAFDTSSGEIWIVHPDGRGLRKVASGQLPSWSPDGSRIAFVQDSSIYVVGVSGGQPERISGTDGASDVAWSPDGLELAFSTWDGTTGAIYLVPAAGGDPRQLTPPDPPARSPAWSPDGRWVAYVRVVQHHAQIALASTTSHQIEALTAQNENFFKPSWTVGRE